MVTIETTDRWMRRLRAAWIAGDVEAALGLFQKTERYYERPFQPGTTQAEIRRYWEDIVSLSEISLEYEVMAVNGPTAIVHWVNRFRSPSSPLNHLDGVFAITFDDELNCIEFRQWWFMAK